MNIEEFVNDYLQEHRLDVLFKPYNWLVEFTKVLKAEMLKDEIKGKIVYLLNGDVAINIGDTEEYKLGDKVRVIIVKEEN